MNPFSVLLQTSLTQSSISRSQLSERTGIGLPTISKYLTGNALPNPDSLSKIMQNLPEDLAAEVFSSYLKEIFPKGTLQQMQIRSQKSAQLIKDSQDSPSRKKRSALSPEEEELEDTFSVLRYLAKEKPEVSKMLRAMVDVL